MTTEVSPERLLTALGDVLTALHCSGRECGCPACTERVREAEITWALGRLELDRRKRANLPPAALTRPVLSGPPEARLNDGHMADEASEVGQW